MRGDGIRTELEESKRGIRGREGADDVRWANLGRGDGTEPKPNPSPAADPE